MSLMQMDWKPPRKVLKTFGFIGLAAFPMLALLAGEQWLAFAVLPESAIWPMVYLFAAMACYCGICALCAPHALRPLYISMMVLGYPIGFVVSVVMMAVVYYLIITPVAIIFRLIGRDALNRRFDPSATSYWVTRRPPADVKRYFRQF